MLETPSEEMHQFVTRLREEIGHTLDLIRIRTYSPNGRQLLSPGTLTAGLVLAAADYSLSQGLSMPQFVEVLKLLTADLEKMPSVAASGTDSNVG